jgi:hypothetical protein
MVLQPKKILFLITFIILSLVLLACGSATPPAQPTASPTTDAVTLPPRGTPTPTASPTVQPTATSGSSTVSVSTVEALTPGATVAAVPTNATVPTATATTVAATTAAAQATAASTPNRTPGAATPTRNGTVSPPAASPAPPVSSPSALSPSGKIAFIREGEVNVLSLPLNTPDNVKLGKALDIAWSPEGNLLAALDKGEIRVWEVAANNVRNVKISESGDRLLISAKGNYALVASGNQAGFNGKVINLKTGATIGTDNLQIGGSGDNIRAGWHPTEQTLAFTAPENQAADLVMLEVNDSGLKATNSKPDNNLSYRFVRWLRSEAIVAKVDLKSVADRAIKDVVKVNRDAKFSALKNTELGTELDNVALRAIPPTVVGDEEKRDLRLSFAPDNRFATFAAYNSKTKSNQIYVLGLTGTSVGQVQMIGAGTVAAWQSKVPEI